MIRDTIPLQNCSPNLGQMFSVLGLHGWRKSNIDEVAEKSPQQQLKVTRQ
jgi:hypothetical protein